MNFKLRSPTGDQVFFLDFIIVPLKTSLWQQARGASGILGFVGKSNEEHHSGSAEIGTFCTRHSAGHQPEKQWHSEWEKGFRKG